ncbi:MAG: hypothetical protein ACTSYB_06540 [Candidatus Helarchaeota archaeon]
MQLSEISLYLFIFLTVYLGILTIDILYKAFKSESEKRVYLYGIAFFTILYMLCRILLIINTVGEYDPHSSFYIWASFFAALGVFGLMFAVEKYIYQKFKFIPSICVLIFSLMILIFPAYEETNLVTYWVILATSFAFLIPILYLKVGLRASGEVRKKSLYSAFGILTFLLGNGMNTGVLTEIIPIFLIFAPITMFIGLFLFRLGLK